MQEEADTRMLVHASKIMHMGLLWHVILPVVFLALVRQRYGTLLKKIHFGLWCDNLYSQLKATEEEEDEVERFVIKLYKPKCEINDIKVLQDLIFI